MRVEDILKELEREDNYTDKITVLFNLLGYSSPSRRDRHEEAHKKIFNALIALLKKIETLEDYQNW